MKPAITVGIRGQVGVHSGNVHRTSGPSPKYTYPQHECKPGPEWPAGANCPAGRHTVAADRAGLATGNILCGKCCDYCEAGGLRWQEVVERFPVAARAMRCTDDVNGWEGTGARIMTEDRVVEAQLAGLTGASHGGP